MSNNIQHLVCGNFGDDSKKGEIYELDGRKRSV